jgi:intein-encoded DNA endonuclease-like protein
MFHIKEEGLTQMQRVKFYPTLEMSENLAYILGVLYGDGYVSNCRQQYRAGLSATKKEFVECFTDALKKISLRPHTFLIRDSVKNPRHQDRYAVVVYSKIFYEWRKKLTLKDTKQLLIDDHRLIRSFLKGFYESEGSLDKKRMKIVIYNSNEELLLLVLRMLKILNFKTSSICPGNRAYRLRILGGRKEIIRFLHFVNPSIKGIDSSGSKLIGLPD